jgi:hypothetical protein
MRMLFQPLGDGSFHRACEADSFRGLVAAIFDDPSYETADAERRLVRRLRLGDDLKLLYEVEWRRLEVSDREAPETINIAFDEPFIRSLERLGFVSLPLGGCRFEAPLRLMPPTIITMTAEQERMAMEALAELIRPIVLGEVRRRRRAA